MVVMLKLTLPEEGNHYKCCIEHDNVLKVVALSGGYDQGEANRRLAQNGNMEQFNNQLDSAIESIYRASSA